MKTKNKNSEPNTGHAARLRAIPQPEFSAQEIALVLADIRVRTADRLQDIKFCFGGRQINAVDYLRDAERRLWDMPPPPPTAAPPASSYRGAGDLRRDPDLQPRAEDFGAGGVQ